MLEPEFDSVFDSSRVHKVYIVSFFTICGESTLLLLYNAIGNYHT